MNRKSKKQKRSPLKIILLLFIIGGVAASFKGYQIYQSVKAPNVKLSSETQYIYIPTGVTYSQVLTILEQQDILIDQAAFEWVAEQKKYPNNVKAGKYKIRNGMSNNALVNLLRSGRQTPVKLVFNKIRTADKFSGIIGAQIEADSAEILSLLKDEQFLGEYNLNAQTAFCMFIPNTYEFFWNTSAESFMKRMHKEHDRFWNAKRLKKAERLNLTEQEVYTLASIVEEETTKKDEKERLAGVYVNRLKRGMRLQADPTVKYALGDFNIKRVLTKHLQYESPYNTYKHSGLPPGPICIPSISSIDAVLNYEKHSYLYFCAKDDFSGYHVFAKSLREHNKNAEKYRRALNRNRIYR